MTRVATKKDKKKKKQIRLVKHRKSAKKASAKKTKKKEVEVQEGTAPAGVVLAILRKDKYVSPAEMQDAMAKAGYSRKSYAKGIADLRDLNYVIVWVWEQVAYTIRPTFIETYKWCLANYKTVMTIMRRSLGAFDFCGDISRSVRAKAYQEAKVNFTAVYNHIKAINRTLKKSEREAA